MSNNKDSKKINYKFKLKPEIIITIIGVFIGGVILFSNFKEQLFTKIDNPKAKEVQTLKEKDKKIKQLEKELKKEKEKNVESNFLNESLTDKFEGSYVDLSGEEYTFELVFEENLKASLKLRCKYEEEDNVEVCKILYPQQKMSLKETNAQQGYVFFEGIEISDPIAYNKEDKAIEKGVNFSISKDKQIETFDMKVWIKDNEMTGFFFDKDGKEFARISGVKAEESSK